MIAGVTPGRLVMLDAEAAAVAANALELAVVKLRADGRTPSHGLLAVLRACKDLGRGAVAIDEADSDWIPTAEAAQLLGLSERAVRNLDHLRRRTVAGSLQFAKGSVLDELALRQLGKSLRAGRAI